MGEGKTEYNKDHKIYLLKIQKDRCNDIFCNLFKLLPKKNIEPLG